MIASLHLAIYSPMLYVLPSKLDYYEELYDQEVKGVSVNLNKWIVKKILLT